MLAASTSASTQELAGFCSSIWRCPRSAWKRPLVVLTDRTRTANDACEWVGSICQIIAILLNIHSEHTFDGLYKGRGSRGGVCDSYVHVCHKLDHSTLFLCERHSGEDYNNGPPTIVRSK